MSKVNIAFDALLGGLTITAAKELSREAARRLGEDESAAD